MEDSVQFHLCYNLQHVLHQIFIWIVSSNWRQCLVNEKYAILKNTTFSYTLTLIPESGLELTDISSVFLYTVCVP